MSQYPMDSEGYLDPDGSVTPLDPAVQDAMAPRASSGELARVEPKESSGTTPVVKPASSRPPTDAALAKIARKRVKKRQEFRQHLAAYLATMVLLWVIWLITTPGGFPWPAIPMLGWGIGIAAHLVDVRNTLSEQDEIDEEISRIRQQRGLEP